MDDETYTEFRAEEEAAKEQPLADLRAQLEQANGAYASMAEESRELESTFLTENRLLLEHRKYLTNRTVCEGEDITVYDDDDVTEFAHFKLHVWNGEIKQQTEAIFLNPNIRISLTTAEVARVERLERIEVAAIQACRECRRSACSSGNPSGCWYVTDATGLNRCKLGAALAEGEVV